MISLIKSAPNVTEAHVVYGVYDIILKIEAESQGLSEHTASFDALAFILEGEASGDHKFQKSQGN